MARLMRRRSVWIAWLTLVCLATFASGCAEDSPEPQFPSAGYDVQADPFSDLQEAIVEATRLDRRILLEVGGEWCIWCHHWERFLADHDDVSLIGLVDISAGNTMSTMTETQGRRTRRSFTDLQDARYDWSSMRAKRSRPRRAIWA